MRLISGTVTVDDVDGFVARLGAVGDEHGVTVQAFDARYVVDRTHLERAVDLADRALARGENVADDRAVEVLLYAAGRRQINRAFGMGVSEGDGPVVVLVDDPNGAGTEPTAAEERAAGALRGELGLDGSDGTGAGEGDRGGTGDGDDDRDLVAAYDPGRVREFFGVGDAELEAVEGDLADVVRERVALLDVEK